MTLRSRYSWKSWPTVLAVAAVMATTPAAAQEEHRYGALAYDHTTGAHGVANDHPNDTAAQEDAVRACGAGCGVVLTYSDQCGAYATDTMLGSSLFGWGTSRNEEAAKSRAIEECRDRGGRCIVRVWGCTTR